MIARQQDGLPLAASVQEDEQAGRGLMDYQAQAKLLFKKLAMDPNPPAKCSFDAGPYIYHYVMERGVCYLVLCDKAFSKRLAYTYLEDLQNEFQNQYGAKVHTVSRPYSFIEFDTYMQKQRKSYMDSRARRNLTNINTELQDVQRIMVQNIDEVLQRGEALSVLDTKANNLSTLSQKYKKDAKYLNLRSSYVKIGAIIIVVVVLFLFIRYWILWNLSTLHWCCHQFVRCMILWRIYLNKEVEALVFCFVFFVFCRPHTCWRIGLLYNRGFFSDFLL